MRTHMTTRDINLHREDSERLTEFTCLGSTLAENGDYAQNTKRMERLEECMAISV